MKTVIKLKGMACSGCSTNVEKALGALTGVLRASADHRSGEVTVEHDGKVDEGTLRKAIAEAGYDPL